MTVSTIALDLSSVIALDIDPNVVKPGWTPLLITVALAAVMVLLYRSMRRQFGRIQMPPREDRTIPQPDQDGSDVDRDVDRDVEPQVDREAGSSHDPARPTAK